jgi:glycine/D-amino acid oxidase-like deaminating enzyme
MKKTCVVGAGIVGLATALYLQQTGRKLTLIDRLPPGTGTSSGNAGIISTGSVFPEAMPGIWKEIPGMLLRPMAPVSIRPTYLPRFMPWLLKFLGNSTQANFLHATRAISALSSRGLEFYEPLVAAAKAESLIRRRGMFYVYETEKAFRRAVALRSQLAGDDDYEVMTGQQLAELEPQLRDGLAGAIFVPGAAYTVSPLELAQAFYALFLQQGGEFVQAEVSGFDGRNGKISAVLADGRHEVDELFVTAGAYSARLASQLGSKVPLETERGYHLNLPQPNIELRNGLLFMERGLGVTPMADGLRLAGTVEFGGLDAPPNYKRAQILGDHGKALMPGLNIDGGQPWMGHRPSVPDSIPVISRSPRFDNVYYGFGHGHIGLTQAAITGALLTALADGTETVVDTQPYRIDRAW